MTWLLGEFPPSGIGSIGKELAWQFAACNRILSGGQLPDQQ